MPVVSENANAVTPLLAERVSTKNSVALIIVIVLVVTNAPAVLVTLSVNARPLVLPISGLPEM
jgi:hypothetical protein